MKKSELRNLAYRAKEILGAHHADLTPIERTAFDQLTQFFQPENEDQKKRKYLAGRLVYMANPSDTNDHTCEALNEAAKLIYPEVEIVHPHKELNYWRNY